MFNFLICEETATGGSSSSNVFLIMMIGIIAIMLVLSFLSNRKRKKQADEMLLNLVVGAKVKTIGGLIGTISAIKDGGVVVINVGTSSKPTLIHLDRNCLYSVQKPENYKEDDSTKDTKEVSEEVKDEKPVDEEVAK